LLLGFWAEQFALPHIPCHWHQVSSSVPNQWAGTSNFLRYFIILTEIYLHSRIIRTKFIKILLIK
jgi:hypothetical protein